VNPFIEYSLHYIFNDLTVVSSDLSYNHLGGLIPQELEMLQNLMVL